MEEYPRVHEKQGSLLVEFGSGMEESTQQPLRMVLDFGQWGEVMGIEILNLAFELGKNCLRAISDSVPTDGESTRYAYDDESDSFSLTLRVGRSSDQKAVDGCVFLDKTGAIIAMSMNWPG
jgi:uncharacterized protein YuzE